MPLPDTSATTIRQASAGQVHIVEVIAAELVGRLVELEEIVARQPRRGGGQKALLHLVGQRQVALHGPIPQHRLVQLGVLHGKRRLTGHAAQHVEIVAAEAVARVLGVDLQHAQRLAVAAHQRGAHDRSGYGSR